jgi:transposase
VEHLQQYVGIDLHRRRSVIVRMTADGEVLECVRIVNDPVALSLELAKAGPDPEVALDATYGWYWAADLLQADGAQVHLVHPLGLHWDARRVKNDERDATELAQRLRRGDLPEAWIAPVEIRELRELIRFRAHLAALRTSAKAQIHAVMAKLGILPPMSEMFGPTGQALLDAMPFEGAYATRVGSLRGLLEVYERELIMVERELHGRLGDHKGYTAIQAPNGVGRITADDHGRRDRRRRSVPRRPAPVLVGGTDAHPPRVRHQGPPRAHHQTRLDPGAMGGDRSRRPLPRRRPHRPGVHAHRQNAAA